MKRIQLYALAALLGAVAFAFVLPQSYAARRANPKYFRYFPSSSKFVGILGPLGAVQRRTKGILNHLKRKNPIGIMLPSMLAQMKQRLGFDPLSSAGLSKHGLSTKTQIWFAGVKMKSPEQFVGLIAPCDPVKLAGLIQKASASSPVHVDKFRSYKVVTLYSKPSGITQKGPGMRYQRPKKKGFSGFTYIAQGKGLLFLAWTARFGVPLQAALKMAKAELVATIAGRKAHIGQRRSFRKALSMARASSSFFMYLSSDLLKGSRGKGLNQLASGMLRRLPPTPLGSALRKQPQLKWGFVELRMDKRAIDLRAFVAVPSNNRDFRLVRKVFRANRGPKAALHRTRRQSTVLTGKVVLNALGTFRAYMRDLRGNPKKANELQKIRRELKQFEAQTGLNPIKDILSLISGHFMVNVYGISPMVGKMIGMPRHQRRKVQMNTLVNAAMIAEVTSNKDAQKVIARLVAIGNKKARGNAPKVTSFQKFGTTIYTIPVERNLSLYFGVFGRKLVLASNLKTFRIVNSKGSTKVRLLRRAIKAKHGGLMFINADAIRSNIGQMQLPFAQRMIVSNIVQYIQGLLGIYSAFTVRRNGLGFGFGLLLSP